MPLSLAAVKILGAALIFVCGCLGSSAPVMAHHGSKRSVKFAHYLGFIQQLMLALGAGVVLATAFVHILPDGIEALNDGGLGGDSSDNGGGGGDDNHTIPDDNMTMAFTTQTKKNATTTPRASSGGFLSAQFAKISRALGRQRKSSSFFSSSSSAAHSSSSSDRLVDDATLEVILAKIRGDNAGDGAVAANAPMTAEDLRKLILVSSSTGSNDAKSGSGHDHDGDDDDDDNDNDDDDDDDPYPFAFLFVLIGVAVTFVIESELHRLADRTQGATMKVHLVEGGIAVHSVLVGIALGTLDDANTGKTLMIALLFHQLCEGFAIGPLIHKGSHSLGHALILIFIFGISTPVGIGIGALIAAYSDPNSTEAKLTQGILMLIAAGLLIYVGCVEFLAGLQHDDVEHQAEHIAHEHSHKAQRRKEKKIVEAASKALLREEGHADGASATKKTNGGGGDVAVLAVNSGGAGGCEHSYGGGTDGDDNAIPASRTSFAETWGATVEKHNHDRSAHHDHDHHHHGHGHGHCSADERTALTTTAGGKGCQGDSDADEEEEHRQIAEMKSDYLSQNPKITRLATYFMFYVGASMMSVLALWV